MSKPLDNTAAWPPATLPSPSEVDAMSDADAREWAELALRRCAELEAVLHQVVRWFDAPLEANAFADTANDDADIMSEAMGLNRIIDRAIALLGAPRNPDA